MSMYDWVPTVIAFSNTESRHEGKKNPWSCKHYPMMVVWILVVKPAKLNSKVNWPKLWYYHWLVVNDLASVSDPPGFEAERTTKTKRPKLLLSSSIVTRSVLITKYQSPFFQRKCEVNHKIFPVVLFMLCAGKFCDSLHIFSGKKDSSTQWV